MPSLGKRGLFQRYRYSPMIFLLEASLFPTYNLILCVTKHVQPFCVYVDFTQPHISELALCTPWYTHVTPVCCSLWLPHIYFHIHSGPVHVHPWDSQCAHRHLDHAQCPPKPQLLRRSVYTPPCQNMGGGARFEGLEGWLSGSERWLLLQRS